MDRPDWYRKANKMQRRDAEFIIKRFANQIQWRYDGRDSLIDGGSGTGDVLIDFVYPKMPKNFERLVCSDINGKILKYAESNHCHIKNSEFKILDIESKNELPLDLKEKFDHVVSFYAIMWTKNQKQALKNIHQLLRHDGGDCILVSLASHVIYDGYRLIYQMDKWSKYMTEVGTIFSLSLQSSDVVSDYAELMTEAGFTNFEVELQNKVYVYESVKVFKDNMKAVNPWLKSIPTHLHDEYMNDLIALTIKFMGHPQDTVNSEIEFAVPYSLLII